MARMHRSPVASICATCAILVITALGRAAFCQPFTTETTTQQRMSTRIVSIQQEIQLGNNYLSGHGVTRDDKQAAYWYEKAAEAGDPWAEKQIGFFYQSGIGVPVDPVRAVHWYQLAAASGLVSAKTNLGVAYLWGTGVSKDISLAKQLFMDAAEKGDGRAATYLGNMYCLGIVVTRDMVACEHWYTVGAKRHDPLAEFDLGTLFSAEDHSRDFDKAAKWFRKSIADGYVPAMHSLALLLETHPELAKSDREFLQLFEEASAYGQWKATQALGIVYLEGKLTPRDPRTAYYYLDLAALQGGADAPQQILSGMLAKLSAETGSEDASRQEAAARGWYRQHPERIELLLNDHARDKVPGLAIATPAAGVHAGQIIAAPPAS